MRPGAKKRCGGTKQGKIHTPQMSHQARWAGKRFRYALNQNTQVTTHGQQQNRRKYKACAHRRIRRTLGNSINR